MLFDEYDRLELIKMKMQEQENELCDLKEELIYKNGIISELEYKIKDLETQLRIFKFYQKKMLEVNDELNDELRQF